MRGKSSMKNKLKFVRNWMTFGRTGIHNKLKKRGRSKMFGKESRIRTILKTY